MDFLDGMGGQQKPEPKMDITSCTYAKLRDGSWGLRIVGKAVEGAKVTVKKKNGTENEAVVGTILYTENGVSLATIQEKPRQRSNSRSNRYTCDECGEWVTSGTRCWETGMSH